MPAKNFENPWPVVYVIT